MADSCAKCGKESKDLRRCTRCLLVAYCNRDCQVSHWKEHKTICIDVASAVLNENTTPYPNRPANTVRVKTKAEFEHSKQLRKALREGTKIVTVAETAQGYILPGEPLPDGVPANFHLKQESHVCFFTGPSTYSQVSSKRGNLKYEKTYREYYDDLVSNEAEWMTFFDHRGNFEHAEHTCGILGTLATVYRQREGTFYKDCEEVLDMEEKVLLKYKNAIAGTGAMSQYQCYDTLEFKYHVLRFNTYRKQERLNEAAPYFRKLLEYELRNNMDFEHQEFLFLLTWIDLQPSPETVRNLTRNQLMKLLHKLREMEKSSAMSEMMAAEQQNLHKRVALMNCAGCGSTESAIGDYKSCSRCEKIFYCTKTCQKNNWKAHKKVCNK